MARPIPREAPVTKAHLAFQVAGLLLRSGRAGGVVHPGIRAWRSPNCKPARPPYGGPFQVRGHGGGAHGGAALDLAQESGEHLAGPGLEEALDPGCEGRAHARLPEHRRAHLRGEVRADHLGVALEAAGDVGQERDARARGSRPRRAPPPGAPRPGACTRSGSLRRRPGGACGARRAPGRRPRARPAPRARRRRSPARGRSGWPRRRCRARPPPPPGRGPAPRWPPSG